MKVCFFGLGSIGTRHLKNLAHICGAKKIDLEVHAFRSTSKKPEDFIDKIVNKYIYDFEDLEEYDIVFVTNPTSLHYDTIVNCAKHTKNFFIEKPLFHKYIPLEKNLFHNNSIFYVACPLRYTNVIRTAKEFIESNVVFSARCICSSYLPEWRANTDYRQSYSAKKELGGGVRIDLIHEMDYLTYLFGFPQETKSFSGTFSNLEIDSDDLAVYLLKYADKLVEVHLDYFGRSAKREIEMITESGVTCFDLLNSKIYGNGINTQFREEPNYKYMAEMEYFMDCVLNNNQTQNDIKHANKVLKLAEE